METSIQETVTPLNRSGRSRKTPPRHLISSTKDNCNSHKGKGGKETSRAFWIMSPLYCKVSFDSYVVIAYGGYTFPKDSQTLLSLQHSEHQPVKKTTFCWNQIWN
jgi:hypothetical protein